MPGVPDKDVESLGEACGEKASVLESSARKARENLIVKSRVNGGTGRTVTCVRRTADLIDVVYVSPRYLHEPDLIDLILFVYSSSCSAPASPQQCPAGILQVCTRLILG